MERELNWLRPTVNTLCDEESRAFINNQEVKVHLVIRNEQSIKSVVINSCIRLFLQFIIFCFLLSIKKFFI
jgi:hypothetical protein